MTNQDVVIGPYKLGWHDEEKYVYKPKKGLSEEIVREMSAIKGEPEWMRNFRLKALKRFQAKPMAPWFAVNMPDLDFDDIYYYIKPVERQVNSWEELPETVKSTYEKLGIPEAERKYLAGVTAQYECLPADTLVLTSNGEIFIKDLRPGDTVVSFSKSLVAEFNRVVAIRSSGVKQLVEISVKNMKIRASKNHPFLKLEATQPSIKYRWVTAEELEPGDKVAVLKNPLKTLMALSQSHSNMDNRLAYLMGAIDSGRAKLIKKEGKVLLEKDSEIKDAEELIELQETYLGKLVRRVKQTGSNIKELITQIPVSSWPDYLSGYLGDDITLDETNEKTNNLRDQLFSWQEPEGGLEFNDACFVEIDSVQDDLYEEVFDIEIENAHNFVANGFVVHNSEVVYHRNREDLEKMGVIFLDMDSAVKKHPDLVKKYFGTVIPPGDNKFAALNSAVWSGGSFIYVPPGVKVEMPLQAYFRINAENMGQFERTLIIADEGASVHYVEGCSAPIYSSDSLHSAVVELIALKGARITYTTIQNWSNNVYNLVTKRARADEYARVEWIDGNIGSRLTMKYPSVFLMGPKASGEVLSVAYAGKGQHQDAGAKMHHIAPETSSTIISKSISKDGGKTTYRGKVEVQEGAYGSKSYVRCDALILDEQSISETRPTMEVHERDASIGHEATVAKISSDALYYLMSRGLSETQAMSMIVNGFIEPVTKTLPMEYAVEWSRLIELQMEGAIG